MTVLDHTLLLRLGVAATATALVMPALPATASDAPATPPARTIQLACPADRVTGADFADTAGNVHGDSIRCLSWYGIAQGTTPETYGGMRAVTRAQLATFLARVLTQAGVPLPTAAADAFTDDEGSAHEDSLNALAALGVVSGDAAGEVNPDDAVRRDQMASLLLRALELIEDEELAEAVEDYFDDDDDNVHSGAINALAGLGIAAGRSQGVFDPARDVLRDQLATFLMRLIDRLVEHDEVRVPLTLRMSAEEVAPGDVVQGAVIGDGIEAVSLSGCGLDGPVADEDADQDGVQFSFTVPAAFPAEDSAGGEADGESTDGDSEDVDVVDECDLDVVVAYVGGGSVTLEAELEYAAAEDEGTEDEAAEEEGAEDEAGEDEAAEDEGAEDDPAADASV